MDDPPKAHPCVQAGRMPALPGVALADRVDLPGETQNENCCRPWLAHVTDSHLQPPRGRGEGVDR